MSRNGDSPHSPTNKRSDSLRRPSNPTNDLRPYSTQVRNILLQSQVQEFEPSSTNKLTWQWQKKASLRNIENCMSEVKERLSSIMSEVEASRKEDKREIKLLLDDLAVSRAKSARLEKTIEELRKEKVNILKLNEEILTKKEAEIVNNSQQYEQSLLRKDEELAKVRKEAKAYEVALKDTHTKELELKQEERTHLEQQHSQNIAAVEKAKHEMQCEYEGKLNTKMAEMDEMKSKYEIELKELRQGHQAEVSKQTERIDELTMKLSDAVTYLNLSLNLIERKNSFIGKQKQGFEKIMDHVGESEPRPAKLKGNLWKLAHYMRTGGQAAWKGYINRAQYDAINEEADAINRIANRAVIDREFEGEDETQFRESLKDLCNQLEQTN